MIWSRAVPFLDTDTFAPGEAREVLFRDDNGLILYLTDGKSPVAEERVVRLNTREALIWLNETPQDAGSFWD